MFSIRLAALAAFALASPVAPAAEPYPDIPRLPTAVVMFWCGLGKSDCEISCTIGGVTRTFSGLHAARVQTYRLLAHGTDRPPRANAANSSPV